MVCSYHHLLLVCLVFAIPAISGIEYKVTNNAPESMGGKVFEEIIGAERAERSMQAATFFIWHRVFQQTVETDKKTVKEIKLIIESTIDEGTALYIEDNEVHQIHISAEHFKRSVPENFHSIKDVNRISKMKGRVRFDFNWMITFGIAHALQWTANGDAPELLRSGIAAVAVLQAHYKPYFWVDVGEGSKWNESYDVIAQFFNYIDEKNNHFVADLNKKMRTSYSESYIEEAAGTMTIAQWWKQYKNDNPSA